MSSAIATSTDASMLEVETDGASLRSRWFDTRPDGISRRDGLLRALRNGELSSGATDRDLRGINLVGEDLAGLDLSGRDLSGAELSECDLTAAKFVRCNLSKVSMVRAKLDRAELLGADLRGANLTECSAVRAGFGHADLSDATLFGVDLRSVTLSGAVLTRADLRAAKLEHARLCGAELGGANLARANLQGVDLGGSNVAAADFENADLRGAMMRALQGFESASWIRVDIRDVNFSGAYLLRRWIMDENYLFEFRNQSKYSAILYRLWSITSDCGRSLARWFAWILGLAFVFGCLYTQVDLDSGDYPTVLSPFYFSLVTLTTLGYGDIVPASSAAQFLAVVEVLLGYLGLGGLLSIFANKMGRRAD